MIGSAVQFAFKRSKRRYKAYRRSRRLPPSVLLISFPKCGRTWLHVMLGRYLVERHGLTGTDFLALEQIAEAVPGVRPVVPLHDDQPHRRDARELVRSKRAYRRHKVIFLVRDPRDVIVSKFYSLKYREKKYEGAIGAFVKEPIGSLATMTAYYNIWLRESTRHPSFMVMRYEDLHSDPERELARIVQFVDENPIDWETIRSAVAFSRFNNMRQLEDDGSVLRPLLTPGDRGDFRTYKTRKGVVGDHANEMAAEDIAYIDAYLKKNLNPALGYS